MPKQPRRTAATVVDFATRRMVEVLKAVGSEDLAHRVSDLDMHGPLAEKLMKLAEQHLDDMLDRSCPVCPKKRLSPFCDSCQGTGRMRETLSLRKMQAARSSAFNGMVTGILRAYEASRLIHGKVNGEASITEAPSADDGKIVIEQRRIEPAKINVDERGRAVGE